MDHLLSVLIAEDDLDTQTAFQRYVDTLDDVKLLGISPTVTEAVQKICDFLPHSVILDLELEDGHGGLAVLQGAKDASLTKKPFFLITTNSLDTSVHEQARPLGADFILYKGQQSYSEKYAMDFLRYMGETIIEFYNK